MSGRARPPRELGPPLRALAWKGRPQKAIEAFPWNVPAVRALDVLDLNAAVTFFVGENGSGKSTVLEAIAASARLPTVGSASVDHDPTLDQQRALARMLRLTWAWKPVRGFYLRAEDFFGHLKQRARDDAREQRERREARAAWAAPTDDAEDEADDDGARPWSPTDAPPMDSAHPDEIAAREHLARHDARSHGESFMDLFQQRVAGGGLYLLDEPEAPLSPQRQLSFLALMHDAVQEGAQFVVATHSPILLAYPGARIYGFDDAPVREVPYEELEHVRVTRDFLNAPERYLRHLL
ncbi:MAG TPA: AAA family ATPase [Gemmatirosa sp.]|nr:AAA family ATPase [Gemmatirosa sp.]